MNENVGRGETFLRWRDSDRRIGCARRTRDAHCRFLCYVLYGTVAGMDFAGGRMRSVLFALTLLMISGGAALLIDSSAANAACTCLCVDGRMQPLCDGAIDPQSLPADGVPTAEAIRRPGHSAEPAHARRVAVQAGPGLRYLGRVRVGAGLPVDSPRRGRRFCHELFVKSRNSFVMRSLVPVPGAPSRTSRPESFHSRSAAVLLYREP